MNQKCKENLTKETDFNNKPNLRANINERTLPIINEESISIT